MLSGDCNVCVNGKMPSYSATCVECGLSRKNYKPVTNADNINPSFNDEFWNAELERLKHCVFQSDMATTIAASMYEKWLNTAPTVIPAEGEEET